VISIEARLGFEMLVETDWDWAVLALSLTVQYLADWLALMDWLCSFCTEELIRLTDWDCRASLVLHCSTRI
jgi:hypothetical protein